MSARRFLLSMIALSVTLSLAAVTPAKPKHWRLLKKGTDGLLASTGDDGGRRRAPWIELAADRAAFDELWKQHVPGKSGDVDFKSESVVFLLLGMQQTGGYAIEPVSVEPPVEGVLRVHARLIQPMGDEPVSEAASAPYAVIVVRARAISKIEWINDGRLLATRIIE